MDTLRPVEARPEGPRIGGGLKLGVGFLWRGQLAPSHQLEVWGAL